MNKIRLFEMFSGYGGASFALKKAGIEFETVGFSEIDKFAIQCYEQNHNGKNFGDCTKIDPNTIHYFDLLTGGFPCQSFSVAGKGLGELDTRGTLFHEIIRIAEVKKPKFMLLENVKGLTNKNHKTTFDKILSELERIGYNVEWNVLNSKDYGIPQNRERVFFACFRKDITAGGLIDDFNANKEFLSFSWPEKEELKIFLKDILEDNVDNKYYLKEEQINKLLPHQEISYCIDTNYYKGINVKEFINKKRRQLIQVNNPTHSNNRVYSEEGISPTLNTMGGGNRQPFIKTNHPIMIGNLSRYTMKYPRSPYTKNKDVVWCISTKADNGVSTDGLTIRKLTPTECFRLMGFLDDEINLEGLSNTQKYKLAGNGWDINLVSKIFKRMLR